MQGVKKGLRILRGYSKHLYEQKCPRQHTLRNQCVLRYVRVLHFIVY
jgi:hypothetical protein